MDVCLGSVLSHKHSKHQNPTIYRLEVVQAERVVGCRQAGGTTRQTHVQAVRQTDRRTHDGYTRQITRQADRLKQHPVSPPFNPEASKIELFHYYARRFYLYFSHHLDLS